jgi:hypothetical protein
MSQRLVLTLFVILTPLTSGGAGASVKNSTIPMSSGNGDGSPLSWSRQTAPTPRLRKPRVFWSDGFERGNLSKWPRIEGDVRITDRPTFSSKYAAKVTTTNASDSSAAGDSSYLETDSYTLPWEMNGANAWFRMRVYLPSRQFTPADSSSGWDMFMEWHNSPGCSWAGCKEYSPYFGLAKNGKHLLLRWVGGDSEKPTFTSVTDGRRLRYNHWYDMVVHAVLTPDPKVGFVAWWVDGRRIFSRRLATLFRRPDGSISSVELEVGHYRSTEARTDVNYIDGIVVGSTASSVRFRPK